jgi:hypothetical protein
MSRPVSPAAALQRVLPADRHLFVVSQIPLPPPPLSPFGPPMKPILLGPAAAWTSNEIGLPMEHILLLRLASAAAARVMPGDTPGGEDPRL